MDLVRELRLRQWARQHYVPAEERQKGWHPVVLEEMRLRDRELSIETPTDEHLTEQLQQVLEPMASDPGTVTEVAAETRVEIDFRQQPWGWTFVPLEPGRHWNLHGESSEIPRPHARKFWGELAEVDEDAYLFVMD